MESAQVATGEDILPMRTRHREEMSCQIVHDSIHRRPGWTVMYRLEVNAATAGYGTVAIAGPWKAQPALLEFYVLPEYRGRAFVLFETLIAASKPPRFEVQSNDVLAFIMAHTYGRDIESEKIVFRDAVSTSHSGQGARLVRVTPEAEANECLEARSGGCDWRLELDGASIGTGGLAFHYNRPYADVYMQIAEPFRRRGFGKFLVQELKRECYAMGAVPAARCSPSNAGSYRTLQGAGLTPFAHILIGSFGVNQAVS